MIGIDIPKQYYRANRFYHGVSHIVKMRELFKLEFESQLTDDEVKITNAAIDFHDIIYNSGSSTNELESVIEFKRYCHNNPDEFSVDEIAIVESMIMATQSLQPISELEKLFLYLDWSIFDVTVSSVEEIARYNYHIFKEFQRYNYKDFYCERMKFLGKAKELIVPAISDCSYIKPESIAGVETGIAVAEMLAASFKPSIGVYVGSFDPFHTGHLNVLQKAEKIFDKVIVVQAQNPSKGSHINTLPESIKIRECVVWNGFIGDCLDELKSNDEAHFAMIRGMRTGQDLIAEQAYQETLKDLGCHYPFCFILCDPEYQHVSSSMIRSVEKIDLSTAKWKVV